MIWRLGFDFDEGTESIDGTTLDQPEESKKAFEQEGIVKVENTTYYDDFVETAEATKAAGLQEDA